MTSPVLGAASNQQSSNQPSAGQPSAGQQVTERPARFLSGWRMPVLCIVVLLAGVALAVQAGHDHRGTIRESGLHWVYPFTERIEVSTRIRNQESAQAKVNDADGNPNEIAAVVVWQVRDTANAVYSVAV